MTHPNGLDFFVDKANWDQHRFETVERVYEDTLAGRTTPHDGHVLSLWEA